MALRRPALVPGSTSRQLVHQAPHAEEWCVSGSQLSKPGETPSQGVRFDSKVWSPSKAKIVIARTAASIDAIPASHSIVSEARESSADAWCSTTWFEKGDQLPTSRGR